MPTAKKKEAARSLPIGQDLSAMTGAELEQYLIDLSNEKEIIRNEQLRVQEAFTAQRQTDEEEPPVTDNTVVLGG